MNKVESVARQNCKLLKSLVSGHDTNDNESLRVDHTHTHDALCGQTRTEDPTL